MRLIKYNFNKSVLILGAIAFSSLGNCSPVFDDAGVSSQKSYKDDFIVDSIIPNDFSSGEARIFGNFSFGNSSILTVAGFVIVGIILFGKFLNLIDIINTYIRYFILGFRKCMISSKNNYSAIKRHKELKEFYTVLGKLKFQVI